MGWARGSQVANSIWDGIKEHIPEDKKPVVAEVIVTALCENDWDTLDESMELVSLVPNYAKRYGFDDDWDD